MRFRSIEFNNYRCFLDGIIEFEERDEKNINLMIGPNGGGKTEMLFAFWWTLYDFDFAGLRGKEDTPYALNSDMYKELEQGKVGDIKACSVCIEFEHNEKVYRVVKKCEYRKTEKRVKVEEYQTLAFYNERHELSLPERDESIINKTLNRIVPKAILYGIIFDGERMQKLSSVDENSKNAIGGVINDITNVELVERCISHYKDIKKEISSSAKKLANRTGQNKIEDVISRIAELDSILEEKKKLVEERKVRKEYITDRLQVISDELKKIEEVREVSRKKEERQKDVEQYEKTLDTYYKNFSASLKEGYWLISERLLDDVEDIIQKYDVPAELTVPAVRNILKRTDCICGRCMDDNAIRALNDLILSLPPDNINSTLAEIVRHARIHINDCKENMKRDYEYISSCEKDIKNTKEEIASLSSQIIEEGTEKAKNLQLESEMLTKEQGVIETDIKYAISSIEDAQREHSDKVILRDELSKHDGEMEKYNEQLRFIDKCLLAFDMIKESNKCKALSNINSKLDEAYKLLSEDAVRGKRIYIVQYEESKKNQMVVYLEGAYNNLLDSWKRLGKYDELLAAGLKNEEICERAIMKCLDANSTGQSKINTFSFVKAILDYSNEPKEDDEIEVQKEYPLLIDAPFGDIAGTNRINSSRELHSFAKQVILMLDRDIFEAVRPHLGTYVSRVYEFTKVNNKNSSIIELKEEF